MTTLKLVSACVCACMRVCMHVCVSVHVCVCVCVHSIKHYYYTITCPPTTSSATDVRFCTAAKARTLRPCTSKATSTAPAIHPTSPLPAALPSSDVSVGKRGRMRQLSLYYHWRELPQVSFLSRQIRRLCRDKSMLVLSRQNYVCGDKYLSRQNTCFVATNTHLSRQTRVCRDKHDKNDTCGSSRQ